MKKEWALEIRDRCLSENVSFFFKQWGGVNKKKAGRRLEDRTWDEMPEVSAPESCPNSGIGSGLAGLNFCVFPGVLLACFI